MATGGRRSRTKGKVVGTSVVLHLMWMIRHRIPLTVFFSRQLIPLPMPLAAASREESDAPYVPGEDEELAAKQPRSTKKQAPNSPSSPGTQLSSASACDSSQLSSCTPMVHALTIQLSLSACKPYSTSASCLMLHMSQTRLQLSGVELMLGWHVHASTDGARTSGGAGRRRGAAPASGAACARRAASAA
jgi:hypothetical protein